jgi:hypothetical protein
MPRTSTVHAVTTIGIDMGKNTLHMIGLDSRGAIVLREKVSRGRIALRLANLPCCLIGIEAGLATHYVARELAGPRRIRGLSLPGYRREVRGLACCTCGRRRWRRSGSRSPQIRWSAPRRNAPLAARRAP